MNNDSLDTVLKKDARYRREAYDFIFEALEFTIKKIKEKRHISGQELLDGIRDYAIQQFGPLAKMVFNKWGVHKTDDFGEIVFNLVNAGLLGKTEQDSREDFRNRYDFEAVFNLDKEEDLPQKHKGH
ncbi:MAG TPA: Minf_1886 family protein [Planctomycetota bacterium]|nr:Minf_1886 family protein [Planctomycetota bacterium]